MIEDTLTHVDVHRQNYSNIDLYITDRNGKELIDGNTIEDTLNSDHFPLDIYIRLNFKETQNKRKFNYKLHNKNTDWELFSQHLYAISDFFVTPDYFNPSPIDKHETFWNIIIETVTSANTKPNDIRKLRQEYSTNNPSNYKKNPAPWWDA